MSDGTAIEWTDATWNPVTGCTKVSPGCAHCYIERTPPFRIAGRRFVDGSTGVQLHPERLSHPLRWRKPRRVFVCSLADLFHDDVPDAFIDDVFATMLAAPQHTFQVLTKRPERARDWFESYVSSFDTPTRVWTIAADVLGATRELGGWPHDTWPLPNVWVGVSIENARHTWRADVLRDVPAAVRFISAEPLLGSLFESGGARGVSGVQGDDRAPAKTREHRTPNGTQGTHRAPLNLAGIDWVIVGGESGPGARPMHADWARELRDACLDHRGRMVMVTGGWDPEDGPVAPAFFFKQWGGARPKANGRELDGRTWDEYPSGGDAR